MISSYLSRAVRRCGIAALLLFLAVPAFAKYPELGGSKQFDLICRGQEETILEPYIPIPMAGPGGEIPKIQPVKKRIIVDLVSMQFLEAGEYHPMNIPLEKDGILYLYNQRGFLFWTVNLDTYKSIFVRQGENGELSVEKMRCRPAKFSGFPFVPSTYEDVLKMSKQMK
jgi:hypothetical protein